MQSGNNVPPVAPPKESEDDDSNDYSIAIERILSMAEKREESAPLTSSDLSTLSNLCAIQAAKMKEQGLRDDMGFTDVDTDWICQLVGYLEKHVVVASSIDVIQETYLAIQNFRTKEASFMINGWIKAQGKDLIDKIKIGLEAASILLFIMTSPGIDRRVVSEDAIQASIILFRHNLSKNIVPATNNAGHIVAGANEKNKQGGIGSPTPSKRRRRSSGIGVTEPSVIIDMKKVYPYIMKTVGLTVLVIERIDVLVKRVPLDDQELLMISSGALISLELDSFDWTISTSLCHQLQVASTGIITSIFRKNPRLRQIIVEDLFPLMLKMPTSKRSMRNFPIRRSSILYPARLISLSQSMELASQESQYIQTISVLIMSLVQSSVLRPSAGEEVMELDGVQDSANAPKLQSGLRQCQAISDLFVKQLLQRCSKRGEDGGASEFRPILSNLIDDLLQVLLIPEYPAAEMILLSIANMIRADLDRATASSKAVQAVESTYLNTVFDAFGKICAAEARILKFARENPVRIEAPIYASSDKRVECYCSKNFRDTLMLSCDHCHTWYHGDCVGLNRDTVPDEWYCDACQLQRIVDFECDKNTNLGKLGYSKTLIDHTYSMKRLVIDYLSIISRKTGESALQDAYAFHLARWIMRLYKSTSVDETSIHSLVGRLLELWDPRESSSLNTSESKSLSGMLNCLSDEGRSRMVVHLLSKESVLLMSFRSQVEVLVKFMASTISAVVRKLSLKAIEKVTESDQQLMIYSFIKKAVTQRFSDEAISVREAAVSLVGSYVNNSPKVANAFHTALIAGLNDPGVSVRKRTIKILEDILCSNPVYKGRAEACSEMLRLAADPKEDDGVRDLIHEVFLKVWLDRGDQVVRNVSSVSPSPPEATTPGSNMTSEVQEGVLSKAATTPESPVRSLSTPPLARGTKSTDRRERKRRLQIRSEIAAEQMVEVVKAADTGENLTSLLKEILRADFDAKNSRKASQLRKRQIVAQEHCILLVNSLIEILLSFEENRAQVSDPGKELVAIMRTIKVFSDVSPLSVTRHLYTLLPYMKADNGLSLAEEGVVVGSLAESISTLSKSLDEEDLDRLCNSSLADDLVKVTYKLGKNALSSAAKALCSLAHTQYMDRDSIFSKKLLKLGKTFYNVLFKHQDEVDFSAKRKNVRANVHRALSVLGSICRYHESSLVENEMDEDNKDEVVPNMITWENLATLCKQLFMKFLGKDDPQTKCAALRGICGIFIAHPRELLKMNESGMISEVMSPNSPPSLQLESLLCWREILLVEEVRIDSGEAKAKMDSKKSITVSKKISGDQDADATLFGGVLTSHAPRLFELMQTQDKALRFASLDLIGHLLRQGQINPNETVPFLLAVQGDVEEDGIRSLALKLLMIEGEKRPDMLRQRVCAGVKQAFLFQKSVYPDREEVSALVKIRKHSNLVSECVFGRVYKECIMNIKKQRRGLFRNLLGLFDLQNRTDQVKANSRKVKSSQFLSDLPMLSFTSQVLAYLPYAVASDPLYIIYNISSTLALRGPDLLDRLALFLRPLGLSSSDEMDENNVEEDALEVASKRKTPHTAKQVAPLLRSNVDLQEFSDLCVEAGALSLLLRLKAFLRLAYNLSEARCIGYNPESKEVAERTISRASTLTFDSQLYMQPFEGEKGLHHFDSMILQYTEFRQLMRAEASIGTGGAESDEEDEGENSKKRNRLDSSEALDEQD